MILEWVEVWSLLLFAFEIVFPIVTMFLRLIDIGSCEIVFPIATMFLRLIDIGWHPKGCMKQ